MTGNSSVAVAAFAAGILVGGGAYAAKHDALGVTASTSADARARIVHEIPLATHRHSGVLIWRPPHVPKVKRPPAATVTAAAPMVVTAPAPPTQAPAPAPAPVAVAQPTTPAPPVTRTSPTGGGDDGGSDD